ncbi:translation initiation factor IF-2 N-terminal domain-containing protein [Cupriavidus basilensis]
MMKLGQMVTINQVLDQETAMIVVEEMAATGAVRRQAGRSGSTAGGGWRRPHRRRCSCRVRRW